MKPSWQHSSFKAQSMLAEISLTPFIGVLQAVVVICMFALPMATQSRQLDMPQCSCTPFWDPPPLIRLALKQSGETYLDGVSVNRAELKANLTVIAARQPAPQLTLVAERSASYDDFIRMLTTAKNVGLAVLPDIE